MNGNTQKLIWWIMGALLIISIGASSALWKTSQDATNRRLATIEADIKAIRYEYPRIAVLEAQVTELLELVRGR